ncbi:MAG TPA: hypothetical protein VNS22_04030 [Geminicoccus sp.]|uniref:hypothetical protein n=1 Tax=Geminicoccus sp. TaxID=2024832 RepID=UPI002CBE2D5A|nr:hypothetical protein [Geminicoccus sp.]HWL67534.1 hypothetical protein [Geminicoccus sp.]
MTSSTVSRAVALFGTEEPVAATRTLRAGPLACTLDAGNLRHVRLGSREAIRAISMIVRDRNWGTYGPEIADLEVQEDPDGFRVTYRATCSDGTQTFAYDAEITGRADGSLTFRVLGEALTDFVTNRAGFVVLHGVEGIAGEPVRVEHVDGSIEESRFPDLIDPIQPFKDIRALSHEVYPGVRVTCRMEGDAYEMEDQRNWLDASYKTYIRPLALPWPYTLEKGERLDLQVTLSVEGTLPALEAAAQDEAIQVQVEPEVIGQMPKLALVVPANLAPLALNHAELLGRAAFPVHACSLLEGVTVDSLDMVVHQLEAFGALGEPEERLLEAVLPCRDALGRPIDDPTTLARDLDLLATAVRRSGVDFRRIALSPACDLKSTTPGGIWPAAPSFEAILAGARAAFPGCEIGGGFFGSFTELNRKRPPQGLFDFLGHAIFPTVHAGDDLSVTEGLEALPSLLRSARAILGETTPYVLYPTAVSMRHNPYGATPAENPEQGRTAMARVDPRDRALLGAAWYAGLLAHAAQGGLDTLCLAAAVGPSGLVITRQPYPQPWFDAHRGAITPAWHVLTGHAALAGASLRQARSAAPSAIQVLAAESAAGLTVWLCNLTGAPRQVRLDGLDAGLAELAVLDAADFERACQDADFLVDSAVPLPPGDLSLDAYAVVRILVRR